MEPIYLPEAVGPSLPASFPGTGSGSRAPDAEAEETETRVEFDGLAEALADLGRLTKPRKGFRKVFDIFAAVDEGLSAMEMRARGERQERTASIKYI